jgi:hypothetical protein
MDERLVQLTITLGGYSDRTWHVALVKTTYDRGRLEGCGVVAQRILNEDQVHDHVARAVQHAIDIELARVELRDRARRAHSPDPL